MTALPIDEVLPELHQALDRHNRCLLQADPGAGKTTRVPPSLLDQPWLAGQKVLMLEPRRIAARSAATFMARELNQKPGQQIGFRSRLETRVGPSTRIEVVTEGILTRMLQQDPALEGVGCVIFDEFHERSLQADLGLTLLLQSQTLLREDLRIVVMSATLDPAALLTLLGSDTPLVSSQGRSYPVATHYLGGQPSPFDAQRMAIAIEQALAVDSGSVLAFLPGAGEIRRTLNVLKTLPLEDSVQLLPLYGSLSPAQQDRALAPCPSGQRKVVLATAIAETSLTLDGISCVVDSGLMRLPRFAPRSGMTRLQTFTLSAASAEQRRGRAGRQQAGHCFRLWSQESQARLSPQTPAEILHADLAPLQLELAQWGTPADELDWLDPPPAAHLNQARELLQQLGALEADGLISHSGQQLLQLGTHPRLATLMLAAKPRGLGVLGCRIAALLSERDPLTGQQGADLRLRLQELDHNRHDSHCQRVRQSAERWCRQLQIEPTSYQPSQLDQTGLLLAFAYPDRIGQRRTADSLRYRLSNGKGAELRATDPLRKAEYLVCADLDGDSRSARIYLASELSHEELIEAFGEQLENRHTIGWDDRNASVRGYQERWLGRLCLERHVIPELQPAQLIEGLIEGIRQRGLDCLPWNEAARTLQQRIELIRCNQPKQPWPELSDSELFNTLEQWLAPYLEGCRKLTDLRRLDLKDILHNRLSWEQQQQLERQLPLQIRAPSGSRIRIDYSDPQQPVLAARLQELFGWQQSPTLLDGRLPLTLHLLSPAQRPIQVTQDLASFWANTYAEVKKDLKGRYPKHYWPDDPLQAQATRKTKKQMDRERR